MPRAPDDHLLAAEEGKLSPIVPLATIALAGLFLLAVLYRIALIVL